jgi:glycosyltransferase involved in cell wall biosynthesis
MGLDEVVALPGWIAFDHLPDYYGLAGAFVHASVKDTWAVVVNEAMASALPVLVSNRCGCVTDLVRHGTNGFVFDPRQPAVLADRLWLIAHGDCDRVAMGRASREIIQDWTPEVYAQSLARVVRVAFESPTARVPLVDRLLVRSLGLL